MIVLTLEAGEAEKLAEGAPGLQKRYGMPITPEPYSRPATSEPACRAVVAARLQRAGHRAAPAASAAGSHDGGRAARQSRADRRRRRGCRPGPPMPQTDGAGPGDPRRAGRRTSPPRDHPRRPPGRSTTSSVARARSAATRRRATSFAVRRHGVSASVPGFNPVEAHEAAIASIDSGAAPPPEAGVGRQLLSWAEVPLATAEVVAIMQQTRGRGAHRAGREPRGRSPAGADMYWSIAGPSRVAAVIVAIVTTRRTI